MLLHWCIRNGQLCIKAQTHTATHFAALLSSGITQAGDPEECGKGCVYFLVRGYEVYPVINPVSV